MKNSVSILGGAQSDFQRNWAKEGKSLFALLKEVVLDAMDVTQIDRSDIRILAKQQRIGIFVGNFDAQQYCNQGHLGASLTTVDPVFQGIPGARYEAACASGSAAIDAARSKIRAGEIDLAVVVGIEVMKSVSPVRGGDYLGTASLYADEAAGTEYPFPKLFGKLADHIISEYGTSERRLMQSLATISDLNYRNAKRNPNAQTRSWYMSREHALNRQSKHNPQIGGRLCIADCSQITDGAACIFLASEQYARSYLRRRNLQRSTTPFIKGYGVTIAPFTFAEKMKQRKKSEHLLPWTVRAVSDAYTMAGLSIRNMDTIETHDCFTSSEYACISAFGITKKAKEFEAIENGLIEFEGRYPVNPSGGLIGIGHPVGATGVRMMLDLWKQLSQNAGSYQLPKRVRNGIMLNIGGSATTNYVFIIGL